MLVMTPGYACELGQDLPSLPPIGGRLRPFSNRILELTTWCHTQLPQSPPPPRTSAAGNSLSDKRPRLGNKNGESMRFQI